MVTFLCYSPSLFDIYCDRASHARRSCTAVSSDGIGPHYRTRPFILGHQLDPRPCGCGCGSFRKRIFRCLEYKKGLPRCDAFALLMTLTP